MAPAAVVRYTIMPCCSTVGFTAGKASILGMIIPSVLEGEAGFVALISNTELGVVVPTPTCWAKRPLESSKLKRDKIAENVTRVSRGSFICICYWFFRTPIIFKK
ncbi:hypothetical protein D3H65_12120 [Paraflavitalea soli]|uniref:Uncharacterized protein n=1 Tax=Paraflavitalea soli TaxID=2315862 RepID=A0A3B7MJR3_9BACT|nr:hypothetical protein D3H65_12120 [Paraflavitalea soli]